MNDNLITATFTTDELAKMVAGLTLLRRRWARVALFSVDDERALDMVAEYTQLINRISSLITEEHGQALLSAFIKDMQTRGAEE